MKILLTGGAGFIGSHLAQRLISRGDTLTIVDNLNDFYDPAIKKANLEEIGRTGPFGFFSADIRDREAMETLFRNTRPDKVIHLAAMAGVRQSLQNPSLYEDVNVGGTANLLGLASRYDVAGFVFGSSSSVYGTNTKVPFHEEDPIENVISPYAATKKTGEQLCRRYHNDCGLRICCLRFFTVYGPRQRPEMAIHKFASLMSERKPLPVYSHGESVRDYTYVQDIVDGIAAALDAEFEFEIFNLGNNHPIPLMRVIELLQQSLQIPARIEYLPSQPGDVPLTYADISKAQALLRYRPNFPIELGIARFVELFQTSRFSV